MLVSGLEVRIITRDGELLRKLTLDPAKPYHGTVGPRDHPKGDPGAQEEPQPACHVLRHRSTMSRDITLVEAAGHYSKHRGALRRLLSAATS